LRFSSTVRLENRSAGAFAWAIDKASAQFLSSGEVSVSPSQRL